MALTPNPIAPATAQAQLANGGRGFIALPPVEPNEDYPSVAIEHVSYIGWSIAATVDGKRLNVTIDLGPEATAEDLAHGVSIALRRVAHDA